MCILVLSLLWNKICENVWPKYVFIRLYNWKCIYIYIYIYIYIFIYVCNCKFYQKWLSDTIGDWLMCTSRSKTIEQRDVERGGDRLPQWKHPWANRSGVPRGTMRRRDERWGVAVRVAAGQSKPSNKRLRSQASTRAQSRHPLISF